MGGLAGKAGLQHPGPEVGVSVGSPLGLLWSSGQGTHGRAPTKGVSGCHLRVTDLQAFQLFPGGRSGFYETGEGRAFLPAHVQLLLVAAKETRATPPRPQPADGPGQMWAHTHPEGTSRQKGLAWGRRPLAHTLAWGLAGGTRHTDTDSLSQSSSWANTVPT